MPKQAETDKPGFYPRLVAARLARLPSHRLDEWRREGIIRPTVIVFDDAGRESLGYTFAELIYLRVTRMLRYEHGLSLINSVRAVKSIVDRFGPPGPAWAEVRIMRFGSLVVVWTAYEVASLIQTGQAVMEPILGDEFREMKQRADALIVPSKFATFVEIDPAVRSGMPVVRGTAMETSTIRRLAKTMSPHEIEESFPVLKPRQIKGALAWERYLDQSVAA